MKEIGPHDQESSMIALEERMHVLEVRVAALTDAFRVLVRGLEDLPTAGPGERPAAAAARRAYDLLLVAESRLPDARADADVPEP